jgi:hypothetical protein
MEILLCNLIFMIFVAKKAPSTIVIATGKSMLAQWGDKQQEIWCEPLKYQDNLLSL